MTRPHATPRLPGPVTLALLAVVGPAILWVTLALATGLIFHFMPAAPFLAGAWVHRWRANGARARWAETAAVLLAGSGSAAAAILLLVATGRPLDDPPGTAAAAAGGALLAAAWLRWPAARREPATAPVPAEDPDPDGRATDRR